MIESAIINIIKSDSTIADILSTFAGSPAVFANGVPETACMPFMVVREERQNTEDSCLQEIDIFIETLARNITETKFQLLQERIEFLFDKKRLTHERYADVRSWHKSGAAIGENDIVVKHYHHHIYIRASRKKWMEQI